MAGRPDGGRGGPRRPALYRGARAGGADRRERNRVLWARSRGVLRALLGRYLDRDPRKLRFVLGPHGKPALLFEGPGPATDLRFNLSHSGCLALYAVTVGRNVGIDVETPRRRVDELAVAERVLGSEQAQRLAGFKSDARAREFLRAWVAHEAVVKCLGLGLATPLEGSPRGRSVDRRSWMSAQGRPPRSRSRAGSASCAAGTGVAEPLGAGKRRETPARLMTRDSER